MTFYSTAGAPDSILAIGHESGTASLELVSMVDLSPGSAGADDAAKKWQLGFASGALEGKITGGTPRAVTLFTATDDSTIYLILEDKAGSSGGDNFMIWIKFTVSGAELAFATSDFGASLKVETSAYSLKDVVAFSPYAGSTGTSNVGNILYSISSRDFVFYSDDDHTEGNRVTVARSRSFAIIGNSNAIECDEIMEW